MMGRSHLLLAGAGYAALAARPLDTPLGTLTAPVLGGGAVPAGMDALALSLLVAATCGLAPDIDKAGSTAARSLGVPTRLLSWGIERAFGHRGGFHGLAGVGLGYVLGDLLGGLTGLGGVGALVAFGWAIHLLTDAWTVHGVPLFWPLSPVHVKLPPWILTGSRLEAVWLVVVLGLLLLYAVDPGPVAGGVLSPNQGPQNLGT
jgi:membrane-bound metal-dependent hydrolase YbcI (DUF457 family)